MNKTVPIDSIFVDRATRQRSDLGDLSDLKESIRRIGLIHPPVVDDEGRVIAGERRYTAIKELGWTSIEVRRLSDLTPLELEQLELDENIRRLDISWQDRVRAVSRYYALLGKQEDSITIEKAAEHIGLSEKSVRECLQIHKEMEAGNELVLNAPLYSTARGITERINARAADMEEEKLSSLLSDDGDSPAEVVGRVAPEERSSFPSYVPIVNANFTEWWKEYNGPRFNLLHCDFPYGITGDHGQGAASDFGEYSDDEDVYWDLLDSLEECIKSDKVVAKSAHLIFWYSPKFHCVTMQRLEKMGWWVNPYPLIWHRSDGSGILPNPATSYRQVYETAFMCSRGGRQIVRATSNLVSVPNVKSIHMSEKPVSVLNHFMKGICDETSRVLDPTCGAGNAIRSAVSLGAAEALGIELSPEFYRRSVDAWRADPPAEGSSRELEDSVGAGTEDEEDGTGAEAL